ncbi:MAG: hypothetical protein ACI9MS_003509 [Glaciecola sp.]|jgi:hypothetical protein
MGEEVFLTAGFSAMAIIRVSKLCGDFAPIGVTCCGFYLQSFKVQSRHSKDKFPLRNTFGNE